MRTSYYKKWSFLKFVVTEEKRIDIIFIQLLNSNSMSEEMNKSVKPV